MKALEFRRKPARYAAAVVAGRLRPGAGASVGPLSLRDLDPPELPAAGWHRFRPRLAGICGSDLATIDGQSSRYFEPIVSFPFVPGHEVVGDLDDGSRAVLVPVLSCAPRGIDPPCGACAAGQINRCERIAFGHVEPGLQSGFCESTGGGWSTLMVAHETQLVGVPDDMTDEAAVLVEPTACALHAARRVASHNGGATEVAVIGAGAIGLLTIAALHHLDADRFILAAAKHPHQRALAAELGAARVVEPDELDACRARPHLVDALRRPARGRDRRGRRLRRLGRRRSRRRCAWSRPAAACTWSACPAVTHARPHAAVAPRDVAARVLRLRPRATSTTQSTSCARCDLERLVSATYPLARYEDAIAHAAEAGRRGAVKIAFDLRSEKERGNI